ncbi:ribonuclease PH [soil metagenome]
MASSPDDVSRARGDGRGPTELRPIRMERSVLDYAEGSCLITLGGTRVLCAASVEAGVPSWLRGKGQGWITAEYSMLPRATHTRTSREVTRGRLGGRTQEIQRLIGRSLRSVVDLTLLGDRTVWLDCDVLQADGGTRTASITGAMVALWDALSRPLPGMPPAQGAIREMVAATSVGVVGNFPVLDLCYGEDAAADVDLNLVMTESGRVVEIQGTAEREPFGRDVLETLIELGAAGIREIVVRQREILGL